MWKYDICFIDRLSVLYEMLFVSKKLQILRLQDFYKLNTAEKLNVHKNDVDTNNVLKIY
jgi:hypothetical protein